MTPLIRRAIAWVRSWPLSLVIPALVLGTLLTVVVFWSPHRHTQVAGDDVWTCSMHPDVRMDKPGQCPRCGMNLIPLSQLTAEQQRTEQQASLETEKVAFRELSKEIRTVGKLDYAEPQVALLTARVAGRVDRVYADFTGIRVKKGDHLVDIYSPDLYSAQAELVEALVAFDKIRGDRQLAEASLEAARTKLRLLGILPGQIAEMEKAKKQQTHLTIHAPIGGVVVDKKIREQQYVKEGDMLYTIANLDPIWLYLDIYEFDLAWIRYGQQVEITVEAYPGRHFPGTVVFVDPFLDDKARTVKVRVNLKNPRELLKPAMYASATIRVHLGADGLPEPIGLEGKLICPMHPEVVRDKQERCPHCGMQLEKVPELFPEAIDLPKPLHVSPEPGKVLAVRRSAVLDTGRRQVTYRKRTDGAYELVDLKLGPLAESKDALGKPVQYHLVMDGLSPGDEVVAQGGFLLDSQRQIEGMPSLLYTEGRSAASLHAGHGGKQGQTPPGAPAHKH